MQINTHTQIFSRANTCFVLHADESNEKKMNNKHTIKVNTCYNYGAVLKVVSNADNMVNILVFLFNASCCSLPLFIFCVTRGFPFSGISIFIIAKEK